MITSLLLVLLSAADVTSAASRSQTLLQYIEGRDDLSEAQRTEWLNAVRIEFGGKAVKDGTDEGVTSAKSVIAAAIFNGVPPKNAAKAAYDAYHDTYRYVPPPIAVGYQLLKFAGRAPKAQPRELAFNFPRYFNEEMAPDVVRYWVQLLQTAKLTASDKAQLTRNVEKTRELMRPMLRERLWLGAELEAATQTPQVRDDLKHLQDELSQDFTGVGKTPLDAKRSYYERYAALSRELGQPAKAQPVPAAPVAPTKPAKPSTPNPKPTTPESAKPAQPQAPPTGWLASLSSVVSSWLGVPYLWGGLDKRGVDCSGFTQSVYAAAFNMELPRNSRAQALLGEAVERDGLRAGDIVFFDTLERGQITHVGIYVGDDQFVHASSSKGVVKAALSERYYVRAYLSSRRLLAQ